MSDFFKKRRVGDLFKKLRGTLTRSPRPVAGAQPPDLDLQIRQHLVFKYLRPHDITDPEVLKAYQTAIANKSFTNIRRLWVAPVFPISVFTYRGSEQGDLADKRVILYRPFNETVRENPQVALATVTRPSDFLYLDDRVKAQDIKLICDCSVNEIFDRHPRAEKMNAFLDRLEVLAKREPSVSLPPPSPR